VDEESYLDDDDFLKETDFLEEDTGNIFENIFPRRG
jgi:hypothetical protein